MVVGIFRISLRLGNRHVFMLAIIGNFQGFQYFNFETNFLKNEKLFQKTGALFFS